MKNMKTVTLNNGVTMPMEGFGVFQIPDAKQCEQAVGDALQAGYRLIDTAAAYMNEEAVGRRFAKAGFLGRRFLLPPNCGFKMLAMKIRRRHFRPPWIN